MTCAHSSACYRSRGKMNFMPPSPQSSQKPRSYEEAARKVKSALLSDAESIRRRYGEKPITLLKTVEPSIRFPKKLRRIFACIWLGQDMQGRKATRFIIKGPRGGGKTKLLS